MKSRKTRLRKSKPSRKKRKTSKKPSPGSKRYRRQSTEGYHFIPDPPGFLLSGQTKAIINYAEPTTGLATWVPEDTSHHFFGLNRATPPTLFASSRGNATHCLWRWLSKTCRCVSSLLARLQSYADSKTKLVIIQGS